MKTVCGWALVFLLCLSPFALSDTAILRNGSSYSGQFTIASNGTITFTDGQSIQYQFPLRDVQSLVFTSSNDTVTLRNGKVYSGHFTGSSPIGFEDTQGIKYQFPISDLESLVFSASPPGGTSSTPPNDAKLIGAGAEISVRTNETIDSSQSTEGQTYSAEISEDVLDSNSAVAIRKGTPAQLLIRKISTGGAMHSAELVLDLYSVTLQGKTYRVVSSDVDESNRKGFGANRRTAEFLGGGAALGALVGGIFGGGRGAGIGAATGAGGGLFSQVLTRGKEVKVPAETTLQFRLEKTLVLQP
jgi:hypothetical protein